MNGFNQERRGLFGGLKVPFDLNGLFLATVAVAVFAVGVWFIERLTGEPHIIPRVAKCFDRGHPTFLTETFIVSTVRWEQVSEKSYRATHGLSKDAALPAAEFAAWKESPARFKPLTWIALGALALGVWALFGGAINRIAGMKIAREEGLELKEAMAFGKEKFLANVFSVVFVLGVFFVFYVVCNTTIAGNVGAIPYFGDLVLALGFPLVLASTFFIVFALVLGGFGFNLAASAIAVQSSDTFDGVSRAWNYVYTRPWQVILCYGLIAVYLVLFLFFGHVFVKVAVGSLSLGEYGLGEEPWDHTWKDDQGREQKVTLPGKGKFVEGFVRGGIPESEDPENAMKVRWGYLEYRGVDVSEHVPFTIFALAWWIWLLLTVCKLLMLGYAVYYVFAASTVVYLLLRKDVEGEDYTEITVEGEEGEEEPIETVAPKDLGGEAGGGLLKIQPAAGGAAPPAEAAKSEAPK